MMLEGHAGGDFETIGIQNNHKWYVTGVIKLPPTLQSKVDTYTHSIKL